MASEIIGLEMPSLADLQKAFHALPTSLAVKHLTPAVRSASAPAVAALRAQVKKGATGALSKAVSSKTKAYRSTATVLGMVGFKFKKDGKGATLHQIYQEFGTKERETKGPLASSYARKKFKITRPRRGGDAGRVVLTPRDSTNFYYRNWQGGTVKTGSVKPKKYVEEAWNTSKSGVQSELQAELFRRLQNAVKEFAYRQTSNREYLRF